MIAKKIKRAYLRSFEITSVKIPGFSFKPVRLGGKFFVFFCITVSGISSRPTEQNFRLIFKKYSGHPTWIPGLEIINPDTGTKGRVDQARKSRPFAAP